MLIAASSLSLLQRQLPFRLWESGPLERFGFGDGEYFRRGLSGWLGHSFHIGLKLSTTVTGLRDGLRPDADVAA